MILLMMYYPNRMSQVNLEQSGIVNSEIENCTLRSCTINNGSVSTNTLNSTYAYTAHLNIDGMDVKSTISGCLAEIAALKNTIDNLKKVLIHKSIVKDESEMADILQAFQLVDKLKEGESNGTV